MKRFYLAMAVDLAYFVALAISLYVWDWRVLVLLVLARINVPRLLPTSAPKPGLTEPCPECEAEEADAVMASEEVADATAD
ncbi:MAG: hypothetical protein KAI25_07960 [Hyphomicrobiaceae bacterium]|nr:hypothetical protein [Hyphomicrobiaceae bacterium]